MMTVVERGLKKDQRVVEAIWKTLEGDSRVEFAYLYGSYAGGKEACDIDIAVYAARGLMSGTMAVDLKVELSRRTGLPPDVFDIRILNRILDCGDLFGLLYLRNVLTNGILLFYRTPEVLYDFLEGYGTKYRECEGLVAEVLA